MTLDLLFVGPDAGRAALTQLTADLGVSLRLIGQRVTTMEIFPVSILTIEVGGELPALEAAQAWFTRRGIHRLTR